MKCGGGGWEKTKNASCSEPGDEMASSGEPRSLHLPGARLLYMRLAPGPMGRELWPPGEDATGYAFSHRHRVILHALCPIGNGFFQPSIIFALRLISSIA